MSGMWLLSGLRAAATGYGATAGVGLALADVIGCDLAAGSIALGAFTKHQSVRLGATAHMHVQENVIAVFTRCLEPSCLGLLRKCASSAQSPCPRHANMQAGRRMP